MTRPPKQREPHGERLEQEARSEGDGRSQEGEQEFWGCQGCGRVATSYHDLLRQGCEGHPERLFPVSVVEELQGEVEEWRGKAEKADREANAVAQNLSEQVEERTREQDQLRGFKNGQRLSIERAETAEQQARRYEEVLGGIRDWAEKLEGKALGGGQYHAGILRRIHALAAHEVLALLDAAPAEEPGRACTCKPTGECTHAMSGPTCMEPTCPPCRYPELETDSDCPIHGTCPTCNGSGIYTAEDLGGPGTRSFCPGCGGIGTVKKERA